MAKCRYHDICGRDGGEGTEEDLCILHSQNAEKDKRAFDIALGEHRGEKGDDFQFFMFPPDTDFREIKFGSPSWFMHATFMDKADFSGARFTDQADFSHATFAGESLFLESHFDRLASFDHSIFKKGAHFNRAEFNHDADFSRSTFLGVARLMSAKFRGSAFFFGASFTKECYLRQAIFEKVTHFSRAIFTKEADFILAEFSEKAMFTDTSFSDEANFRHASFTEAASFSAALFAKGADFYGATFVAGAVFLDAKFLGRTVFAPPEEDAGIRPMFSGIQVDLRGAIVDPLDALVMRDVDLEKCQFLGTDLRKAEITGAKWCPIGARLGVFDEVAPLREGEPRQWHHIERVYRELKQNFEERRDYERAGDFHYGEKEMRRKNVKTRQDLRVFLCLYRLISGYGERFWPPLIWAGSVLLLGGTIAYLISGGLFPKGQMTPLESFWDLPQAFFYSFKVMTLLKPDDFMPVSITAKIIHVLQSLLGPILLGLFALALRQRLKR